MGLLMQARSVLEGLSQTTKESAYVAIRKGSAIIPLDFVEPARTVRVVSFLGTVLPSHCTAAGKVHLVYEAEGAPGQNLPENLDRFTDNTIIDRNALREQMKLIGEAGYAVERGEFAEDVNAVAVPVRDYTRSLVGTMAVVGPAHRLTEGAVANNIAPVLLKAGAELSKRLGFPG
jgi:DNA-binding IclR family transcriptional regulator